MLHHDELPALALFAKVVRAHSFSAAAREVGLAKSAVSKRIAQLEARLGVRLLMRTTRKLALTSEGAAFYEQCEALLKAAEAAHEAVAGASQEARGLVRVNAPVTFAQLHLARALALFLREQPAIEVELAVEDRMVDVVESGADLVVRVTRPAASSLVARRLARSRLVVCGSPAYLRERGVPEDPGALLAHDCLHYTHVPFSAEWRFRGAQGAYGVPARSRFASGDGTVLREAAIAGLGLAVLPHFMVARDVADGRLRLVLEGFRRAEIGVYALSTHRELPKRTRLLVTFLKRHFGRAGWELGG